MKVSDIPQQNSTRTGLRPVQARVVAEIAQGRTITAAALAAGINRTTVYIWKRDDPLFKAELFQAQVAYVDELNASVRALAQDAVAAVREIVTSQETPAAVRLAAATKILHAAGALSPPRPVGNEDVEECELLVEQNRLRRAEGRIVLAEQQQYLLFKTDRLTAKRA